MHNFQGDLTNIFAKMNTPRWNGKHLIVGRSCSTGSWCIGGKTFSDLTTITWKIKPRVRIVNITLDVKHAMDHRWGSWDVHHQHSIRGSKSNFKQTRTAQKPPDIPFPASNVTKKWVWNTTWSAHWLYCNAANKSTNKKKTLLKCSRPKFAKRQTVKLQSHF